MVSFDGIWLDMNEPSTMCDGPCYEDQRAKFPVKYKLHYIPGGRNLEDKSVDLDALGKDGHNQLNSRVVTPVEQLRATNSYFMKRSQRAMIISRGNFAGLGKYGSRWGGDNNPTPAQMGFSNIELMYHNIMGIPLGGADICGVGNNTTPELCARWHVVGAFYPFSRNHNWWLSQPQEPWVFDTIYSGSTSYTDIMRNAIKTKYSMIRYYYTELSLISETGGAFFKPLFFSFPEEPLAYEEQYNNVMLGDALKLSVLADKVDQNSTLFHFPAGTWCDISRGNFSDTCFTLAAAASKELPSFAFNYYVHLREGYIVPKQEATEMHNFNSSQYLQNQPVDFHVNPLCAATCNASGVYLNDDGEVLETEGYRNIYNLSMSWDKQGDVLLQFAMHENATEVENLRVN
jgi:alpha-glucosidase (family GH31 glycosyl hydrolase)